MRSPHPLRRLRLGALKKRVRAIRARRPHGRGRERMRHFGVKKNRYLFAIPLLIALIALTCWLKVTPAAVSRFRPREIVGANPLMGWAVDAKTDPQSVEVEHTLVYATLTWRDFEPSEGVYDFERFEAENHLDAWWAAGKRLVLRFVADVPGDAPHADVPDWLLDRMADAPGVAYENEYGLGFSPNYTHLTLIARHRQAIRALGERYNGHDGVAFIEMGSLGHNGAWTVEGDLGDYGMPPVSELSTYLWHYKSAFPDTPLLAASPYAAVKLSGMGLYNEDIASVSGTWDWLDAIEFGGYDENTGAELRGMDGFYKNAPSAARVGSGVDQTLLFTRGLASFIRRIEDCHTSYVSGVRATDLDEQTRAGMSAALSKMGYRLWVREARYPASLRAGYRLALNLTVVNDGAQTFALPWPVEISLMRDGAVVHAQRADIDARAFAPGRTQCLLSLDLPKTLSGDYDIAVAILDPITGQPAVAWAMNALDLDRRAAIGRISIFP